MNTYAYVGGDPLDKTDVLGLLAPETAFTKALLESAVISQLDGPEPGPADIGALSYLGGAIISIAITAVGSSVIDFFNKPDADDIVLLIREIQLYNPNFTALNTRTWDNHQQLVNDLFVAQYEFVHKDMCYVGKGKELYIRARQNLAFRDSINNLASGTVAFISPGGIYFPNESIYKYEVFLHELYQGEGGNLGFEEWYLNNTLRTVKRTADSVNNEFIENDWNPPYKKGTQVTEYTSLSDEKFVRFHFGPNEEGQWIVKKEAVFGLTPSQIKTKYSLKHEPTLVSDVNVSLGTRIRKGKVESNFGGNQGAIQYEVIDTNWSAKMNFTNPRPISEL